MPARAVGRHWPDTGKYASGLPSSGGLTSRLTNPDYASRQPLQPRWAYTATFQSLRATQKAIGTCLCWMTQPESVGDQRRLDLRCWGNVTLPPGKSDFWW
jgi:hypothetical protein